MKNGDSILVTPGVVIRTGASDNPLPWHSVRRRDDYQTWSDDQIQGVIEYGSDIVVLVLDGVVRA